MSDKTVEKKVLTKQEKDSMIYRSYNRGEQCLE